jgi:PPOX class probable F420-dependent enzyme
MEISHARYVSLVTYKRSGEAVAVPVWIAPLADGRAGLTTAPTAGKVKRIRANPSVTLEPCDLRGKVAEGAEVVPATAAIVTEGPDLDAVEAALSKKYGIQLALVDIGGKLKRIVTRKRDQTPIAVVITFPT